MKIVTVANSKGGVGKTTTAINLSHALARRGHQVLLADLSHVAGPTKFFRLPDSDAAYEVFFPAKNHSDAEAGVTQFFTTSTGRQNLSVLCSSPRIFEDYLKFFPPNQFKKNLLEKFDQLDYVVIDTAPSGGSTRSLCLYAADILVLPTHIEANSISGLLGDIATVEKFSGCRPQFFVLPVRVPRHPKKFQSDQLLFLKNQFSENLMPEIFESKMFEFCWSNSKTIFESDSVSKDKKTFENLAFQIEKIFNLT